MHLLVEFVETGLKEVTIILSQHSQYHNLEVNLGFAKYEIEMSAAPP